MSYDRSEKWWDAEWEREKECTSQKERETERERDVFWLRERDNVRVRESIEARERYIFCTIRVRESVCVNASKWERKIKTMTEEEREIVQER